MSDDKIDFSSLDASRDMRRWERMIAHTTQRAMAARAQATASLTIELARLSWPLTTAAAIVVAMALLLFSGTQSAAVPGSLTADSVSEWANAGEIPLTADVVSLTGDSP